jgi:cytochrome c oxidase subunit 2
MRNRRHYIAVTALVLVVAVLLYFLLTLIYQLPAAASQEAVTIDDMFDVYFALIAFMFSLIMVIMLYAAFAFRRQSGDSTDAAHIEGNTKLEVTWTIVPVVIVLGLGAWGATTLSDLTRTSQDEMVIRVVGQQWSWSFEYPEHDNIASGELVLPADQPVLLKMTSLDVIHSFWVPEFRVKQDLLPGRDTELRFTPTETGVYALRCAEICGLNHTDMVADVKVLSRGEFDVWVSDRLAAPVFAELSPEDRGRIWYSADGGFACLGCHTIDGTPGVGPTWLGLYGRQETLEDGTTITVDDAYIRHSILNPNAQIVAGFPANVMSAQDYGTVFSTRQAEILASEGIEIDIIDDLIAYIKTLK